MDQTPTVGLTVDEFMPDYPVSTRPRPGSPNVVIILLDDTGFAQLGCFGSDVATPNMDRIAAEGLRYNRFHVTALCSPTRACLLTGRNHHAVGAGFLVDMPLAFPGYNAARSRAPPSEALEQRTLRQAAPKSRARRVFCPKNSPAPALVAQRIEHRPPEPCAQVRVLPRALISAGHRPAGSPEVLPIAELSIKLAIKPRLRRSGVHHRSHPRHRRRRHRQALSKLSEARAHSRDGGAHVVEAGVLLPSES